MYADLKEANLSEANLQEANLKKAKLNEAKNLTNQQIKSACFWDQAKYKGEWDWDKETKIWLPKNDQAELENTNFIEDLKKDKSSDPEEPVDCSSLWSR